LHEQRKGAPCYRFTEHDLKAQEECDPQAVDQTMSTNPGGTPPQSQGTGRGLGWRGGGGQGHGRGHGRAGRSGVKPSILFKGVTSEMNGHVFQCAHETTDKNQFMKALEGLLEYIAKNVTNPGDMLPLTKELVKPTVALPAKPPTGASKTVESLFLIQLKSYSAQTEAIDSNLKAVHTKRYGANAVKQCDQSSSQLLILKIIMTRATAYGYSMLLEELSCNLEDNGI